MQILNPCFKLDDFCARVRAARSRVLMLDYDGTLAPFRIQPAEARPYPGMMSLLELIQDAGHTRLIVVSGRWTNDLIPLLSLKRMPEIWGSHGWERLDAHGRYSLIPVNDEARKILIMADQWMQRAEKFGARCERKPVGMALHWRGLSDEKISQIRNIIFEDGRELERANLYWQDFDGGIELRPIGWDKGKVVETLVAEAGADAVFAYLGDDLTDESAFEAMPERGIAVLVRKEFRPTTADLWLQPPAEVSEFLTLWHRIATGDP